MSTEFFIIFKRNFIIPGLDFSLFLPEKKALYPEAGRFRMEIEYMYYI